MNVLAVAPKLSIETLAPSKPVNVCQRKRQRLQREPAAHYATRRFGVRCTKVMVISGEPSGSEEVSTLRDGIVTVSSMLSSA